MDWTLFMLVCMTIGFLLTLEWCRVTTKRVMKMEDKMKELTKKCDFYNS